MSQPGRPIPLISGGGFGARVPIGQTEGEHMSEIPGVKPAFKDPKPAAERIVQLAQRVLSGDILLPRFQRSFVWNRKQMLDLLDSVARNYPIGSMLLWQSRQQLASESNIAGLAVQNSKADYPLNYLLDGQQRLSTICGALYWEPGEADSIWNIAYDLKLGKFLHLSTTDEPALHVVPLRYLSNPSSYFSRLLGLDSELAAKARNLFDRFTDYQVAIVTLGDMSIQDVAPVFERINSTGTPLTIVDLMRAATWSPTFDLVDAIDAILEALEPKRFSGIDRKTLLRAVAAAAELGFESAAIDDLRDRTEPQLQNDVAATLEASKRAADFLATQIGAPGAKSLPYANQFAVLVEVFRRLPLPTSDQYAAIRRWFWRTTLASYFGGWNTGQMASDRQAVIKFANGETAEIQNSGTIPTGSIWSVREFRSNSATSKMLALMLGHHKPVDLKTGQKIDVAKSLSWSNDKEFHHLFPKAFLRGIGVLPRRANSIANIVMLSSISNIQIRDRAPSVYLAEICGDVGEAELRSRLAACLVDEASYQAALADDFEGFIKARSAHLQTTALALVGVDRTGALIGGAETSSAVAADDSDSDSSD
jgi:hypothetical protein